LDHTRQPINQALACGQDIGLPVQQNVTRKEVASDPKALEYLVPPGRPAPQQKSRKRQ
jgi:hypothetical protein